MANVNGVGGGTAGDVATLGLVIDQSQVLAAEAGLAKLGVTGERAAATIERTFGPGAAALMKTAQGSRHVADAYADASRSAKEFATAERAWAERHGETVGAFAEMDRWLKQVSADYRAGVIDVQEYRNTLAALRAEAIHVRSQGVAPTGAELSAFNRLMQQTTVSSAGVSRGLRSVGTSVGFMAASAVGANSRFGSLASTLLLYSSGGAVTVAVLGGIAGMGLALRHFTSNAREAKAEMERLREEAHRLFEEQHPALRTLRTVEEAERQLAERERALAIARRGRLVTGGVGVPARLVQDQEELNRALIARNTAMRDLLAAQRALDEQTRKTETAAKDIRDVEIALRLEYEAQQRVLERLSPAFAALAEARALVREKESFAIRAAGLLPGTQDALALYERELELRGKIEALAASTARHQKDIASAARNAAEEAKRLAAEQERIARALQALTRAAGVIFGRDNTITAGLAGASGGFSTGTAIGGSVLGIGAGPAGAAIGALVGILGSLRDNAREAAIALAKFEEALVAFRGGGPLEQAIATVRRQAEELRKANDDVHKAGRVQLALGYDTPKAREYAAQVAEINRLEAERIQHLRDEAAELHRAAFASLAVRRAAAGGASTKTVDDLRFAEEQRRELQEAAARLGNLTGIGFIDDMIRNLFLSQLRAVQEAERLAREAAFQRQQTEYREDLEVRRLRAEGLDAEADALALALAQQREYAQAVRDGATEATLAALAETQRAEQIQAAADKMRETIAGLTTTVEGLRAFQTSLRLDPRLSGLSLTEQLRVAREEYDRIATLALAGDQTSAGRLPEVARQFLNLSRQVNASGGRYQVDFTRVLSDTDRVAADYEGRRATEQALLEALLGQKERDEEERKKREEEERKRREEEEERRRREEELEEERRRREDERWREDDERFEEDQDGQEKRHQEQLDADRQNTAETARRLDEIDVTLRQQTDTLKRVLEGLQL